MSMRKFTTRKKMKLKFYHKFPLFTFKVEIASPRCSLFSDVKEVIELVIWTDTVLGVEIMLAISNYFIGKRSKSSLLARQPSFSLLLNHIAGSRKFPTKDHRWLVRINHVSTIKLGGGKSERQFLESHPQSFSFQWPTREENAAKLWSINCKSIRPFV